VAGRRAEEQTKPEKQKQIGDDGEIMKEHLLYGNDEELISENLKQTCIALRALKSSRSAGSDSTRGDERKQNRLKTGGDRNQALWLALRMVIANHR